MIPIEDWGSVKYLKKWLNVKKPCPRVGYKPCACFTGDDQAKRRVKDGMASNYKKVEISSP
jgi:hypothetical protein